VDRKLVELFIFSANLSTQQPNEALKETMHYKLFPETLFLRYPVVYTLNNEMRLVMHRSVAWW